MNEDSIKLILMAIILKESSIVNGVILIPILIKSGSIIIECVGVINYYYSNRGELLPCKQCCAAQCSFRLALLMLCIALVIWSCNKYGL